MISSILVVLLYRVGPGGPGPPFWAGVFFCKRVLDGTLSFVT